MSLARFVFGCSILFSSTAWGGIVSVTGQGELISAPSQVLDGGQTNRRIQGFNERQGVLLTSALSVDNNSQIGNGGVVAAGTRVSSHMLFLNSPGGSLTRTATFTFDGTILGVMSDSGGLLEAASTALLGVTNTTEYPSASGNNSGGFVGFTARGLEGNDSYSVLGNQLTITMRVAQPGDWVRVVTVVPEPSGIGLFALGAIGLIGGLRTRRASR